MFKLTGTTLKFSSVDHPQTDGHTEVVNRCLETYLRCFCARQPKTWPSWLACIEYWFNTTFHGAAGMTPFRAVYGREPPTLLRLVEEASKVDEVNVQIHEWNKILNELKENLSKAQNRMKKFADVKRREVSLEIGDLVFVKL